MQPAKDQLVRFIDMYRAPSPRPILWVGAGAKDALKAGGVRFVPQILELNFRLQARAELSLLKLHGSRTDWASTILSGESSQRFRGTYPLLHNQLDLNLRVHPLLFVGCSMQDPRVLGWLRALPVAERTALFPSRVLITEGDWSKVPPADQALLATANVKAVTVAGYADVAATFEGVAAQLAP